MFFPSQILWQEDENEWDSWNRRRLCERRNTHCGIPSGSWNGRQLGEEEVVSKKHLFVEFLVDPNAVPQREYQTIWRDIFCRNEKISWLLKPSLPSMIQSPVHKNKIKTVKNQPTKQKKIQSPQQTNKKKLPPIGYVTYWTAIGQLNCLKSPGQLSLLTYSVHAVRSSETVHLIPIIISSFFVEWVLCWTSYCCKVSGQKSSSYVTLEMPHYTSFQIIIHISWFLGLTLMLCIVRNFFCDYAHFCLFTKKNFTLWIYFSLFL